MGVEERWGAERIRELRELYPPLRRYAAVVGRSDVDPDDLVQQAFTEVLARDPHVIQNLGAYVRRTIVNLASNERRRTRRAVLAASTLVTDGVARDDYPSELADLLALAPRDRALLYLVEVEGATTEEAAVAVGMRAPAARMALTRARRRLRGEHVREEPA
ncbi:MAG TPA: sigma factor [Acidimicrobiia bacterium]|nr:sigma factor [Acidimicrobiia bacterium]